MHRWEKEQRGVAGPAEVGGRKILRVGGAPPAKEALLSSNEEWGRANFAGGSHIFRSGPTHIFRSGRIFTPENIPQWTLVSSGRAFSARQQVSSMTGLAAHVTLIRPGVLPPDS